MKNIIIKKSLVIVVVIIMTTSMPSIFAVQERLISKTDKPLFHDVQDDTFFSNIIDTTGTNNIRTNTSGYDSKEENNHMWRPATGDAIADFVPGCILVEVTSDVDISTPDKALGAVRRITDTNPSFASVLSAQPLFPRGLLTDDAEKKNEYGFDRWVLVEFVDSAIDVVSQAQLFKTNAHVTSVELNYLAHLDVVPNDPYFGSQWALRQSKDCDIDAPEAWDIETGDSHVIIAVIDTGVDYTHQDLAANIGPGYDFVNNDNDPRDDHGHGTLCSGIASAVTNNGIGIAGVCWNCTIMPLKGFNAEGTGSYGDLSNAVLYAADHSADVISMSWGGKSDSQVLHDALEYAYAKGVVLVASAGNDDSDVLHYPAAYDSVISVAATDCNDEKDYFSNWGPWVDVAAPGVDILSTMPTYTVTMNYYGYTKYYCRASGTSMACPHVAGLAGLLLSKNHSLTPAMVHTIIDNTVDVINTSEVIGRGRINADKALQRKPATAILHRFPEWRDVKGVIALNGSAWGEQFNYFVIEYGRGRWPDQDDWTELTNATLPQDGVLATWDTTQMEDAFYMVRLRVVCTGSVYDDILWVVVNNKYNFAMVDDTNTGGPWDGTPTYPYRHIQDGLYYRGKNDDVYVRNGTYYEHLVLNNQVSLCGENKNTTVIDGGGEGSIVSISADRVSLSGFTVRNGGSTGNDAGIHIENANYVTISGNNIVGTTIPGMLPTVIGISISSLSYCRSTSYNTLSDNLITNNRYGVVITQFTPGLCRYTTIAGNIIMNNSWNAIDLNGCNYTTITGNLIMNNSWNAIDLSWDTYTTISGNTIINNGDYALCLQYSSHTTIVGNNIPDNQKHGIYLMKSSASLISKNTITYPIILQDSLNTTINNNIISKGIRIAGTEPIYWNTHTIKNNTAAGKPICYYKNNNSGGIIPSDAAQVILANCSHFLLKNLNLSNVDSGIQLGFSSDNTVSGNIITYNVYCGVTLLNSSNNTISENTITYNNGRGLILLNSANNNITGNPVMYNNGYGIYLKNSYTNIVSKNMITYNKGYGIFLDRGANNTLTRNYIADNENGESRISGGIVLALCSDNNNITENTLMNHTIKDQYGIRLIFRSTNNTVYHNKFINNFQHAFDDSINIWDNGYPSGGNYWDDYNGSDHFSGPNQNIPGSDGIGDTPYAIPKGSNQDKYPLMLTKPAIPDLDCDGDLSWTDVKPGSTVHDTFSVKNVGDPLSTLDWEITEKPGWGTWVFIPSNGTDLSPEAGPVTVKVSVVAPNKKNKNFTGEVKIVNKENSSDFCIVQVSLMTPRDKQSSLLLMFIEQLLERFPLLKQIFLRLPVITRVLIRESPSPCVSSVIYEH